MLSVFAFATAQPKPLVRGMLGLLGVLLLADSAYLVSVQITHVGVLLTVLLGAALLTYAFGCRRWLQWLALSPMRLRLWGWTVALGMVWLLSVALFFARLACVEYVSNAAEHEPTWQQAEQPQWLLVLGAGAPGGVASPVLAQRLDKAFALAQRYPLAPVVVSGGRGLGQQPSEARVMADYLQQRGLPVQRIVLEERSTSTHENIIFSAQQLAPLGFTSSSPVLIVTSDFHTLRALRIARKAGWTHAQAAAAPTPLYVRYHSWLREYFAFVSGFVLAEY